MEDEAEVTKVNEMGKIAVDVEIREAVDTDLTIINEA